jgi:hypothetical protein
MTVDYGYLLLYYFSGLTGRHDHGLSVDIKTQQHDCNTHNTQPRLCPLDTFSITSPRFTEEVDHLELSRELVSCRTDKDSKRCLARQQIRMC